MMFSNNIEFFSDNCFTHIHVPRTGGTYLDHILVRTLRPYLRTLQIYIQQDDNLTVDRLFASHTSHLERLRLVSGHIRIEHAELLHNPVKFAIFRDPLQRAISDFFFSLNDNSDATKAAKQLGIVEYCRQGFGQSRNGQSRFLSGLFFDGGQLPDDALYALASSKLKNIDYVAVTDNYGELLSIVSNIIGIKLKVRRSDMAYRNAAPREYEINSSDAKQILDLNSVDQQIYRDVKARLGYRA